MSRRLCARIGADERRKLDALAALSGLSVSEMARQLAILAVGGTHQDAAAENEAHAVRAELARERLAETSPEVEFGHPSPRALASDGLTPPQTVTVRLGKIWYPKVRDFQMVLGGEVLKGLKGALIKQMALSSVTY